MSGYMGRIVHPHPPYFFGGVVTCPDCGRLYWGSALCVCGAALHGPRRKPHYIDPSIARHWLIERDGSAELFDSEATSDGLSLVEPPDALSVGLLPDPDDGLPF
jgi:hypothetical protein